MTQQNTAHEPGREGAAPAAEPGTPETAAGGDRGDRSPEERLRVLEAQVQTLAQALRALAGGLEEPPIQEPEPGKAAARGARLAHELLLTQGL